MTMKMEKVLEQFKGQTAQSPEARREQLIRNSLFSDKVMDLIGRNKEPYDTLMAYYRCAIMEVETKFNVLNEEFSIQYDRNPIESIKSRIKSTDSLARKMRKNNVPLNIEAIEENISDIAGVRVVCAFTEDIYMLEKCLLQQDDIKLLTRKDYIANPKESGYRSLHLIIEVPIFLKNEKCGMKVEVQLRTIAMDCWASLEHKLKYKKELSPELLDEVTQELVACAEVSAELDRRMQAVRDRIEEQNGGE